MSEALKIWGRKKRALDKGRSIPKGSSAERNAVHTARERCSLETGRGQGVQSLSPYWGFYSLF